jgi:hypothetical protein
MRHLRIQIAVSTLLLLAACATPDKQIEYITPPAPEIPADVQVCLRSPTDVPESELDAGQVERLWKTDRARLAQVNGCLRRLICSVADYRREISKVEENLCKEP